jgi:hypothetical protein
MKKHDWAEVLAALQDLLEQSQEEEPHATAFHGALETVIASLPDEAYES